MSLLPKPRRFHCHLCNKQTDSRSSSSVHYCSEECRKEDEAHHKKQGSQVPKEGFELAQSKMGQGLFAKRYYERGELVLKDPVLVEAKRSLDTKQYVREIKEAVSRLSKEDREKYFSLHDEKALHGQKTAEGIFFTNAVDKGETGWSAVFARFSRLNHSCTPNVHYVWNASSETEQVRAMCRIFPGEELLACYIDPYMPRDKRQREIALKHRFRCQCETCQLEGDELRKNDRLRTRISKMDDKIANSIQSRRFGDAVRQVRAMIDMLKEDHSDPVTVSRLCYDAFQAETMNEQYKAAKKWAKDGLFYHVMAEGPTGRYANKYRSAMDDPEQFMLSRQTGDCAIC